MSSYEDFTGREYVSGRNDCYSVLRDYSRAFYGLSFPNFARPERFWEDPFLDLYSMYASQGFKQVLDQPLELGDVLLMPIGTVVNSHAVMLVDDNRILHHFPGQLSTVDTLRPKWFARVTVIIRHPKITAFHRAAQNSTPVPLHEVLNARVLRDPSVQAELEKLLEPRA